MLVWLSSTAPGDLNRQFCSQVREEDSMSENVADMGLIVGRDDYLLNFLKRLGFTPLRILIFTILGFGIPLFAYAWVIQGLFGRGQLIGLLADYDTLITTLVGLPFTWLFYLWLPREMNEVVRTVQENGIILEWRANAKSEAGSMAKFGDYAEKLRAVESKRIWHLLAVVIVLFFQVLLVVPQHMNFKTVVATNGIVLALYELWFFPAYYVVVVTATRGLIFTWWLSKVFSDFKVRVSFLHPDKCGGLGIIGSYVAKTGYVIGLWGLMLFVVVLSENHQLTGQFSGLYLGPIIIMPLTAYVILAPVAFFVPMWKTHLSMKQAQDEELSSIANSFNESMFELKTGAHNVGDLKTRVERLENLTKLSDMVSKIPVWPFSLPNLVNFFVRTYVIPAIFPAVITLSEKVSSIRLP